MPVPVRSAMVADVGARIRALRKARGMTQAQVAEPQYTKAYISMLESGRTRASMKALEHVAAKLDVRPADLLATSERPRTGALQLLDAERLLATDRPAQARELLASLSGLSPEEEARRLEDESRGALRTRDARAAAALGERALNAYTTLGDQLGATRAKALLGSAHVQASAFEEGIRLLREALGEVGRGPARDVALELGVVAALASAHAATRQAKQAQAFYERAIGLADEVLDAARLAESYARVAERHREAGRLDAALGYKTRSAHLAEHADLRNAFAAVINEAALLHLRRGERQRARKLLERAAAVAAEAGSASTQASIALSEAELAASGGEPDALARVQQALRSARKAQDPRGIVHGQLLLGELLLRQDPAAAKRAFASARAQAEARLPDALTLVYERWSAAMERAGESEEALRLARLALDAARGRAF